MSEIIGLDIGYRYTNITNGKITETFPSVIGKVFTDTIVSLPDRGELDLLHYSKSNYFVGEAAQSHMKTARYTLNRFRTESEEYKILFLYALYSLYGKSKRNLKIVTGLPHDDLVDKAKVIKTLKGNHKLKINDRSFSYRVEDVVVIPQPLGTLVSECYKLNGRGIAIKNPDLRDKASLIIDFGGLTIGFMRFDKAYSPTKSSSIEMGLAVHAIRNLQTLIREKYNVNISADMADSALRTGQISVSGKPVDVTRLTGPILDEIVSQAISVAHSLWDDTTGDEYMLLTGGGTYYLGDRFIDHFGRKAIRKVRNPHLANVKGFHLYGLGLKGDGYW